MRHLLVDYRFFTLGRARALACEKIGIPLLTAEYTGNNPLAFIIAWNMKRRHLTTGQRAAIATEVAKMPAHRPEKSPKNLGLFSQEEAAKQFKVSDESIRQAKKVYEAALDVFQFLKEGKPYLLRTSVPVECRNWFGVQWATPAISHARLTARL